jgi:hypothetical protein
MEYLLVEAKAQAQMRLELILVHLTRVQAAVAHITVVITQQAPEDQELS